MRESKKNQSVKRKRYSAEFKDRALLRADQESIAQVARDLGLADSMLYSWRSKQRHSGQTHEVQKQQQAEMARLKRELERVKQKNAFLKKTAQYFAKEQEPST